MIAPDALKTQVLGEPSARVKLARLPFALEALARGVTGPVPFAPARDVDILDLRDLPTRPGLSTPLGQARLLHDLASIELQAMELCLRTLHEFPDAPAEFRAQLIDVAADEGRHLALCLNALDDIDCPWGSFPTHLGLWRATAADDDLLDRVLIVHRYLEGSGLDASDSILNKLRGVGAGVAHAAVAVIRRDELGHVQFGSRWYRALARTKGLDPAADFAPRLNALADRVPRRLEPIRRELRTEAGFTESELDALENLRFRMSRPALKTATDPRGGDRA